MALAKYDLRILVLKIAIIIVNMVSEYWSFMVIYNELFDRK